MDKDILHKEIDLIQTCITRMANNSFLLKGWAISIIAVVLALADKTVDPILLSSVVLIPLFSFWYLDAFFLRTEKMYRKMYEWVLQKRGAEDITYLYDLNPHRFKDEVDSTWEVMWSITLRCFYGTPLLITLGVIIFRILK
ncbi:MAG: hypothetical protein A2252_06320 [Elusimicrobia bacterium RIFOXYA2_FULL_39_19]|nr:MAG: hypothetical protein A2252_06320 [Elusimicrobia bacterium RIFOXYA2_FULL_39_19]